MKIFKKVFAFAIALAAIAMASSAMAADAVYNNGVVTVPAANISGQNQTAVAVVANTFGGTSASVEDVYYINQGTTDEVDALLKAGLGLKANLDVPAAFQVRVGGEVNDVYAIPAVVTNLGNSGANNANLTIGGSDEGTSRLAFDGSLTVNGKGLERLMFELTAKEAGEADLKAVFYSDSKGVVFNKNIASIFGDVTFGLEIDNVPDGVTVTLDSVTAVAVAAE